MTIHHVSLPVSNLADSIEWYRRAFGCRLLLKRKMLDEEAALWSGKNDAKGYSALLATGGSVYLELFQIPGGVRPDKKPCPGPEHLAFRTRRFDSVLRRLQALDTEVHWNIQEAWYKPRSGFTRDPDGNVIELTEVRFSHQLALLVLGILRRMGFSRDFF